MTDLFFAVVSSMIVIGVLLILVFRKLSDLEEAISGQADRLSQELFVDYGCINEQFSACLSKIDGARRSISVEIACLATKNNEDIKRMGGKFEEWDLIELDENEVLIYSAKPNANGQMVFNCVDKVGKMYTFFGSDKLNDAKFLRHTSSPFEEN